MALMLQQRSLRERLVVAFVSKDLECTKNETFESIKSLLDTFADGCASEYRPNIMSAKPCISNHMTEIEIQTKADSLVITRHVQNAMHECARTKSNIDGIVTKHLNRGFGRADETVATIEVKSDCSWSSCGKKNIKNMTEQLEKQNQYYTDIINELQNRILSIERENQATFAAYSQIMSNAMNLQMKCDCIQIVCETCSKMYIKVSDYEEVCRRTGNDLNLKIEHCKSELSMTKEKRKFIWSEWNEFQTRANKISESLSENTNKYIEMNDSSELLIREKTNQLRGLNRDIRRVKESKQQIIKKKTSGESMLEKLKTKLTALKESRETCITRAHKQDSYTRKLSSSIKDLDEKIEKLTNKTTAELNKVFTGNYINDRVLCELYSVPSVKLKIPNTFDEIITKISELEIEKNELRRLADTSVETLKRERSRKAESQTRMSLEVEKRRKLLDFTNKKMENAEVEISRYKDIFTEAAAVDNGLEDCTEVLLGCSRNVMIENGGKTLVKIIEEERELSSSNLCLSDELRHLSHADSGRTMEALLEERIKLLQDRMKAITAQREQIEEANRGLEEELNKLSKNFVKIANSVKNTDETEEEKTN